jgi:hypothetical protein
MGVTDLGIKGLWQSVWQWSDDSSLRWLSHTGWQPDSAQGDVCWRIDRPVSVPARFMDRSSMMPSQAFSGEAGLLACAGPSAARQISGGFIVLTRHSPIFTRRSFALFRLAVGAEVLNTKMAHRLL